MQRRVALGLSMAAVVWGVALVVGTATFPAYSGTSVSVACPGCPQVRSELPAQTLIEVNGPSVLIPVGLPLVVAALVALVLWSGRPSMVAAWVLITLLWLFTLLAMFSIGTFIVPSALLLTLAAALSRKPGPPAAAPPTP
jgi:hypothetical protein